MKREKFEWMFLIAAFAIWVGSGKDVWSSILLILASVYMLCDAIPELWRWIRDAKRKP